MSRRLVLSYSIIFVILPFILILIFGGTFIAEGIVSPTNTEMLAAYATLTSLAILGVLLAALYLLLLAFKIDRTPDVKWLVIGTFMGFLIYLIIALFTFFETMELKYAFLDETNTKLLNELLYLPLILVPFTLILPIFGFSKIYLTNSRRCNRGSIII